MFAIDDNGQTILEYTLLIAVFILVVVTFIPGFNNSVVNVFTKIRTVLDSAPPT
jgi:Flp pilus assembly pilin Flp